MEEDFNYILDVTKCMVCNSRVYVIIDLPNGRTGLALGCARKMCDNQATIEEIATTTETPDKRTRAHDYYIERRNNPD